jgi:hypothetical protein
MGRRHVQQRRRARPALQVEKIGLSGKLDLGSLKVVRGLRSLSFMDNEFSGTIPAGAFAGMGSRRSKNGFTGPILASLADVPRLLEPPAQRQVPAKDPRPATERVEESQPRKQ